MTSQAILCYQNHAENALSVTASSARAGYAAANSYDWRTTTYWSPTAAAGTHTLDFVFASAVTADAFACYRHNLATCGASLLLQYSNDSGSTWNDCFTALTPTDNECVIEQFASASADYWRLSITTGNASECYLGIAIFGEALSTYRGMPLEFVLPRHGRRNQILNNETEGGQFGGRSIVARGARTEIQMQHVSRSWVRSTWETFVQHAELKPFFFSWNHASYPGDAAFCWADGDIPDPVSGEFLHQLRLPVRCLLSGDF